ncbi:hypothetical protein [Actinoplanes sp. NPDC049681]|uniref:hypothetical protein n=1 Tax=Actinoplanes sp. NPDC049681 TaxID=3363905 RepID=UPI00379CAD06
MVCSHGDVIAVLLSWPAGAYRVELPPPADRGGWYTVQFPPDRLTVISSKP